MGACVQKNRLLDKSASQALNNILIPGWFDSSLTLNEAHDSQFALAAKERKAYRENLHVPFLALCTSLVCEQFMLITVVNTVTELCVRIFQVWISLQPWAQEVTLSKLLPLDLCGNVGMWTLVTIWNTSRQDLWSTLHSQKHNTNVRHCHSAAAARTDGQIPKTSLLPELLLA